MAAAVVVCGVLYLPRHRLYFAQSAYREFFERLPATLELIIASVVLALVFATVCTLLLRKRTAWIGASLAALLFIFMCIPLFWLTLQAQLVLAVYGVHLFGLFVQFPSAGLSQYDSFRITDRFAHLALPATLLALFQAGAYVDSMRTRPSAQKLFAVFAQLLPAIISADVIVEIFFAWPGVGRMVYMTNEPYHTSYLVALLLISAAAVIAVRSIASIVRDAKGTAPIEIFEPL